MIIPVMKDAEDYAREVQSLFHKARMYVDIDTTGNTLQKKIRNAQLAQYNFVLVVGAQEKENRAVNARNRDDPATQQKGAMMLLDEALKTIKELRDERRLVNAIEMEN
jgi:threonyl-tRNA synthetase